MTSPSKSSSMKGFENSRTTLLTVPYPRQAMASCLSVGRGGVKKGVLDLLLRTPRDTVVIDVISTVLVSIGAMHCDRVWLVTMLLVPDNGLHFTVQMKTLLWDLLHNEIDLKSCIELPFKVEINVRLIQPDIIRISCLAPY